MRLKVLSAKWRSFCLGLNELRVVSQNLFLISPTTKCLKTTYLKILLHLSGVNELDNQFNKHKFIQICLRNLQIFLLIYSLRLMGQSLGQQNRLEINIFAYTMWLIVSTWNDQSNQFQINSDHLLQLTTNMNSHRISNIYSFTTHISDNVVFNSGFGSTTTLFALIYIKKFSQISYWNKSMGQVLIWCHAMLCNVFDVASLDHKVELSLHVNAIHSHHRMLRWVCIHDMALAGTWILYLWTCCPRHFSS